MKESFLFTYVRKPFQLLIKSWSIFILFLVFLVIIDLTDKYTNISFSLSSSSVFATVPKIFYTVLHSPTIFTIIIVSSLVKSYLIVGMGKDMMNIFTRGRKGLISSLRAISWNNFWWFVKVELLIYVVFNAIAITFYTLCYFIWLKTGLETLPVVILFGAFAFFYPLFYFSFSLASMVCVFPIGSRDRFSKIYYFMPWKVLKKTYIFYGVRLSLEYLFLFVLPFIAVYFFKNTVVAKVFALFGLLLPLLLLRGSAYTFKLKVLESDPDIKKLFGQHFKGQ